MNRPAVFPIVLAVLLACNLSGPQPVSPPPTAQPAPPTNTPPALPSAFPPTAQPASATAPEPATPTAGPTLARPARLQIGLNFIRFYVDDSRRGAIDARTPHLQPAWIFDDWRALGVQAFRQAPLADLFWDVVEPQAGQWHFTEADTVLTVPDFEPVATLFAMQYASPTPPWERDPNRFQKTLGPEARNYLEQVIARYGDFIRYWEIGNEMDHWRAADPGEQRPPGAERLPLAPPGGFSPQEQGAFLAEAANFIRARDPDAVIVLPGLSAPADYPVTVWFAGVLQGGGSDWFDVVNYHYYGNWQGYCRQRAAFQTFLDRNGLADKPVWMTESGATRDPNLTLRTNYPNSPQAQAADIFRRLAPAYALGDDLVMWHTYLDSPDLPGNPWRGYGIRSHDSAAQPAYYALQLFIRELLPFQQAEVIACDGRGANIFRFVREDGRERYIVWGTGTFTIPNGLSEQVSVAPDAQGRYIWQPTTPGQSLQLSDMPLLLR